MTAARSLRAPSHARLVSAQGSPRGTRAPRLVACLRYHSQMLNHVCLAQTLRRPLPTKDGGTLHTVADAAKYIVALPEDRRRTHWDRAAQLPIGFGGCFRTQPPARTRFVL